ncbi:helix-turn-helix domain-containing protein [Aerococcus urinaeequi]|uniref:TOTE conflict system archaeo-eukaryotic primase domain-containing protein n=1 Tax=Aerococcus urinaeequi TaxID=51665 RepID=UPI002283059B|nr:hypothetical protein [Aerococcus urinaeequi]MCY7731785.1 helix-turn-helix domain-containing protein [Aerococcus urinaeequi]
MDSAVIAERLLELYFVNRSSYIEQYRNKRGEVKYTHHKRKITVNDLVDHVEHRRTLGAITDPTTGLTNFISFDVDTKDNAYDDTLELVELLVTYYGIDQQFIYVSNSGHKGYHVELFFDEAIQWQALEPFYLEVINKLGKTKKEVELRPTANGLKLPLSINRKTSNLSLLCLFTFDFTGLRTLNQEESVKRLLNAKQIDLNDFKEFVLDEVDTFTIEQSKASQTIEITNDMNFSGRLEGDQVDELESVLEENRLIYPDSRNRISWLLPVYLKQMGYSYEESEKVTLNVLTNTYENYEGFISKDTSYDKVVKEVIRLNKQAFDKNYVIKDALNDVAIYKSDIKRILEIKRLPLKKMALSMLILSKRYAGDDGVFYASYSTLIKMGNVDKNGTLKKYMQELEQLGLLEIVSSNVIDTVRTKAEGKVISKPNKYRVHFAEPETDDDKQELVLSGSQVDLQIVLNYFYSEKELRKALPRRQFESIRI